SAFTGTGFTTKEAETITKGRRRRKIVKALMIAGNAGMAVAIAAVFQSFQGMGTSKTEFGGTDPEIKVAMAALFIFSTLVIYRLAIANWVNRWLSRFIEKRLAQVTDLAMPHFERVLQLGKGYGISEIRIRDGHPATGKTLQDLAWGSRGVLVLAIERGTKLISSPRADTEILDGDEIVCYGPAEKVRRLATARSPTKPGRFTKAKEE
ncbi:MAG: hypothetical protein O7H41_18005, partial [Planctomycetota bacterium]|nr:hypothetical protein [Planctomycetota bacterium]